MVGMEQGFAFGTNSSRLGGGGIVIGGYGNLLSNSNGERQYMFATETSTFHGGFYRDAAIFGGKAHFHRTKNRQSRSVPMPK